MVMQKKKKNLLKNNYFVIHEFSDLRFCKKIEKLFFY